MYSVHIIDFASFITVDNHLLLETLSPSLFGIRLSRFFAQIAPGCGHTLGQFYILFFSLITLPLREILFSSTTLSIGKTPVLYLQLFSLKH